MKNFKLTIEYDGSRFKGWQRQKTDTDTVQGRIEAVLSKMTEENVEIIGSGRTDSGVHAYGQVANFKTHSPMKAQEIKDYLYTYLPEDIVVTDVKKVDDLFHARYNVVSKTYVYKIWNAPYHDPFKRKYVEHVPEKLNLSSMKDAARIFEGEHDFTSFCSAKSKKKSNVRVIHGIDFKQNGPLLEVSFHANGFLYNMVRVIVGTLIEVGHGRIQPKEVQAIMNREQRAFAGPTVSPKGLYLVKVEY